MEKAKSKHQPQLMNIMHEIAKPSTGDSVHEIQVEMKEAYKTLLFKKTSESIAMDFAVKIK